MTARVLSAEDAAELIQPTDSIGFGIITGTPVAMLRALSQRSDWTDLRISGGLVLGAFDVFRHPNVHYRASFYGGAERQFAAEGADTQHIPSFFRHYGLLIQHMNPRVMLAPASMPDANGRVSLSLYNGAHHEELVRAARDPKRLLIVECSPHYPRTHALAGHENHLDLAEIDVIVYTDEYPTVFANDPGTPEDFQMAAHAAAFIRDGSTLQTGIGAVPSLVAQALARGDGGDYGVHSEMFTDGLYQLIAAGKVTNQKKSINPGVAVITFAAGTRDMYDFIDDNPTIGVAPVFYTNNPHVIAQNHRMVSINSALEVDLHGQIVADTLGPRQYSGVGGHQDFVEGTSLSLEHTSLICLQSTAVVGGELKSRIIGDMTPYSVVTSPRQLAGVIVTEFGAADLRGLTVRERAEVLVEVAHPQFRDELASTARLLGR
ncbi:MAG TPA: acetyl-CoA hydrolase/transferase C-terminal domain-containing protein [Acidimicrobiales bacterium]|nr:acetyl-CoA hydrolase/transferase C-terminal domain-containing protein [Acidimicrobiales bacterium]